MLSDCVPGKCRSHQTVCYAGKITYVREEYKELSEVFTVPKKYSVCGLDESDKRIKI